MIILLIVAKMLLAFKKIPFVLHRDEIEILIFRVNLDENNWKLFVINFEKFFDSKTNLAMLKQDSKARKNF